MLQPLQGETLLGLSADDLARLKGTDEFGARCKAAMFQEWAITTQSRAREYNGERRMRHTVFKCEPVNYAKEGAKLVELIGRY